MVLSYSTRVNVLLLARQLTPSIISLQKVQRFSSSWFFVFKFRADFQKSCQLKVKSFLSTRFPKHRENSCIPKFDLAKSFNLNGRRTVYFRIATLHMFFGNLWLNPC